MSEVNPIAISTRIWREEAEPDNPFATRAAYCRGYDVYGEMLGRARWVDMLFLLFRDDAPSAAQGDLLESLAVALANPGPRDPSVHAAMCGGTCGSTAAAALIAALGVGAGRHSGSRDVYDAMLNWKACGFDLPAWRHRLAASADDGAASVWENPRHPAGFDPNGVRTTKVVLNTLECLAGLSVGPCLPWLKKNIAQLESAAGKPLSLSGVAAAAFADLGFDAEQGEMCHLLLRLPGAAAHAVEQRRLGHKKFPFFSIELDDGDGGNDERT